MMSQQSDEAMSVNSLMVSASPRLRVALALAIVADLTQMIVFPLFAEGGASPAEDVLDLGMAGVLTFLLGWHWEFLPSFFGELVPGLDMVPFWTMAVANVYRKSRRDVKTIEGKFDAREPGGNLRSS